MSRYLFILILAAVLCACGSGQSDRQSSPDDDQAESEGPKTGYGQALERAKDVEKQASEAAEERRKEIEKLQEGGGEP